jgi:hypothetical protein
MARYFGEFFHLCSEIGVAAEPVVRWLTLADYSAFPVLGGILVDHRREAEAELKDSQEQVYGEVLARLRLGQQVGGVKVNLVYLGRLMSSSSGVGELLQIIRDYFEDVLKRHPRRNVAFAYLDEVLPNRIVVLAPCVEDRIRFRTHFHYLKWIKRDYRELSDVLLPDPRAFEATVCDELRSNLTMFDAGNRSRVQSLFDRTRNRHLLRTIAPDACLGSECDRGAVQLDRELFAFGRPDAAAASAVS